MTASAPAPIRSSISAGVLPARVQGPDEPGVYRWSEWSKDHPIFEPFDQPEHGDLRGLIFARITRLAPEPGARVLVSAEGKRRWSSSRQPAGDDASSWPSPPTTPGETGPSDDSISR